MCGIFFFNDTATTEIYTLSLHDALPISGDGDVVREDLALVRAGEVREEALRVLPERGPVGLERRAVFVPHSGPLQPDRKSTRLNSSHANISYAVFSLKKKNNQPLASDHH